MKIAVFATLIASAAAFMAPQKASVRLSAERLGLFTKDASR